MKFSLIPLLSIAIVTAAPAAGIIKGGTFLIQAPPEKIEKTVGDLSALPAINAYNERKYLEALSLAEPLAKKGHPKALLIMAIAYEHGRGVETSTEKAIEYYRKAVSAGNRQAAYFLPELLIQTGDENNREEARKMLEKLSRSKNGKAARMLGEGVLRGSFGDKPDFDEARTWFAKATAKDDVEAMLLLGRLFLGEFGFPEKRDPATALEYFLMAASAGNPTAMAYCGSLLLNSEESIRNEDQGREWLNKAIAEKHFAAYFALGDFEQNIKENNEAARGYFRKGAEAGDSICMIRLANYLLEGTGGAAKNPSEAVDWLKKAGDAGVLFGYVQAARILLNKGDKVENLEAYGYLVAAAEAGMAEAQNEVGMLYLTGRLGTRDGTAAAAWFGRAATAGFTQASYNLAILFERGYGVPQNFNEAGRLYTMAANAGIAPATTAMGRLHAKGLGTKKDLLKAWALYTIGLELGDEKAKAPLVELTSSLSTEQLEEARKVLAGFKKPNTGE